MRNALRLFMLQCSIAGCGNGGVAAPDLAAMPADMATTFSPPDALRPPDLDAPPDLRLLPEHEFLSGADGLGTPVIDANADESGNLWVVTPEALYIRRAGTSAFRRYTNADGLHIWSEITAVAGGEKDEGYVGLMGHETDYPDLDPQDLKSAGKAEHVHLMNDGSIASKQYSDLHVDVSANYWETRSARRLLFVHDGPAAGHLFLGGNHGITHIWNDTWGDHIHVEVYYQPQNSGTYGDWYGLAVVPSTGELWTCGKNACGLQEWNADPRAWVNGHYRYAFTVFTDDHGLEVPFGSKENFVGTALGTDGTAYFLSKTEGLAAWRPNGPDYQNIHRLPIPGLGTGVDVAADPDGTIWFTDGDKVLRFHPDTNAVDNMTVPVSDVRRIYMDTHVTPRTVYLSAGNGLYIYRGK